MDTERKSAAESLENQRKATELEEGKQALQGLKATQGAGDGFLTKDAILTSDDRQVEVVNVPEWGGKVRVRGLTARERDEFEAEITEERQGKEGAETKVDTKDIRAKLAQRSMVDGDGGLMFTKAEVTALTQKSAKALNRVFSTAQRLSGLTRKDVDELAGNSGTATSADTSSD